LKIAKPNLQIKRKLSDHFGLVHPFPKNLVLDNEVLAVYEDALLNSSASYVRARVAAEVWKHEQEDISAEQDKEKARPWIQGENEDKGRKERAEVQTGQGQGQAVGIDSVQVAWNMGQQAVGAMHSLARAGSGDPGSTGQPVGRARGIRASGGP